MPSKPIKQALRKALANRGLSVQRQIPADLPPATVETIKAVLPFTMTSVERIMAMCSATEYILDHDIPGAFVESGVWRGGSSMAAALTLVKRGMTSRDLYLFDTFAGIPAPGEHDALIGSDHESLMTWWRRENSKLAAPPWLEAPVDQVRANMAGTGYDMTRVHTVPGLVEDTVPAHAPEQIALLRLDTDYYSSTKVELETMFPRISPGGVLIIDDYGYTTGVRKAVDEFLADSQTPLFLQRIDSCARLVVKPISIRSRLPSGSPNWAGSVPGL